MCCCIGGDGQEVVRSGGRAAQVGGGGGRRRRGRGRGLRGPGLKGAKGGQSGRGGRRLDASSHCLHHFVILQKVHRPTRCPLSTNERFNYH